MFGTSLWIELASPYIAAMGDSGAVKEDVVESRALLGVPGDVQNWIDHFFMNEPSGVFSLSVLADIFVRVVFFFGTCLALRRCCGRVNEREVRLTQVQLELYLESYMESQRRYLSSDSYIRRVTQAATSAAAVQISSSARPADPLLTGCEQLEQAANSLGDLSFIPILQKGNSGTSSVCYPDQATEASTASIASPTKCENSVTGADQKRLRKRLNDCIHMDADVQSRSMELSTTSSRPRTAPDPGVVGKGDNAVKNIDVVVDVLTVQGVFPTSASMETGNRYKHIVKDKMGIPCEQDIFSSRIIQARVRTTDENLSALRDVAVEGMKLDKGFTLQIGGSLLYCCNGIPEEPVLLSLRDVEVPTILQAEYSAGVLILRGRYLEGAEIRAATFDGYMILNSLKQDQIDNVIPLSERRIEVWRCTDLLPPVNLDRIQICASKREFIEGHDVTVRSAVSSIQNTSLRTIIRSWVPTAILIVFLTNQAWLLLELLPHLVTAPLQRTWISYPLLALALFIIQLLPPSLEDNIKVFVERIKLAISCFHVVPDLLSSPPFLMRSGYCFQRGAKHLVSAKRVLVEDRPHQIGGFNKKGTSDINGSADQQEQPHSEKIDEILPTNRDWEWPCFEEEYCAKRKKNVAKKFYPDSKQKSHDISVPFTVSYSRASSGDQNNRNEPLQYIPQNIVVKLYSKVLRDIIMDMRPTNLKLFDNYGEIQAKGLLVLFISKVLKQTTSFDAQLDVTPSASCIGEGPSCLDMFHLIRFLRREYEEALTQYERMVEANVISWDMLWTLIVPKADAIYYCNISKEELCGKVLSTNYKVESFAPEMNHFSVEMEVYAYNSISFEAMKIEHFVLPFKDEMKISELNVYPLQFKADDHKGEEFFIRRGRKYYDVVLKHERRFMQYQGRIFDPPWRSKVSNYPASAQSKLISPLSSSSQDDSIRSTRSVDGRVMVDHVAYAQKKPRSFINTTHPSNQGWFRGNGSNTKPVIVESDPMLRYAPAIAYGFSFSVRKWRCFSVEGFSEIHFISTAFDTLVMNKEIKQTLLTLSEYHIKQLQGNKRTPATNVDPLPNKGKGSIILLHGPPGTGKTLTVESLAEKLECPLWQLCISKEFKRTEELETDLLKTFEIAASWQAILVLDEADVYLSTRKYSPMSSNVTQTNAMTGVFLRILEYYTGILFLTTNMIDSIEPAIYSRMSLFVKYEDFNIEDRKRVWINFFNRIGFQGPSQEFWDRVLSKKFNGRVIRNTIQNAQILALSEGVSLSEEHLLKACHAMAIPFAIGQFVESEEKSDLRHATATISTYSPSVAPTSSTLSHLSEEEE